MNSDTPPSAAAAAATPAPAEAGAPGDAASAPGPAAAPHATDHLRSTPLIVLAILAGVYTLHWASAVFIPLLLGVMLSYALTPLVNRLERWHLPRALGAALLMVGLCGTAGTLGYSLSDEAISFVESLPATAQKLRQAMQRPRAAPPSAIDKVQKAATELERAADASTPAPQGKKGVTRVAIERPTFNVKDYLWSGTLGLLTLAGQGVMVIFIAYFLLASGTTFRRKMVKLAGPTLSEKRVTVQALDEINEQIQRYLLVQLFTSAVVGVATWLAFLAIGLEHAPLWGLAAAVTNMVPYVGALIIAVGAALAAFVQFNAIDMALVIAGVSTVIQSLVDYLLLPWLTSRSSRLNPVAVFVGVLAWGWLWGLWGLLLGAPILMAVKTICDRVDDLKPVGELLGS